MEHLMVEISLTLRRLGLFGLAVGAFRVLTRHRQRATRFYASLLKPGDLCFDIGAHIGERAAVFSRLGATVVAVEPVPSSSRRLAKRFAADPNVTVVPAALGAREGTSQLWVSKGTSELSTTSPSWIEISRFRRIRPWLQPIEVTTTTLDRLIHRYGRPAFCKIDVEGAEAEVLAGLSIPLPLISFEFTQEMLTVANRCLSHLEALGPVLCNWSYGETFRLSHPDWTTPTTLLRLLGSSKSAGRWGDIYVRSTAP